MSLIIKSKVQKARKTYTCDNCIKPILSGERYRYFYGAPDIGDKPYGLRMCKACDPKQEDYRAKNICDVCKAPDKEASWSDNLERRLCSDCWDAYGEDCHNGMA